MEEPVPGADIFGWAGVKVTFALLCTEQMRNAPYRGIANATGVASDLPLQPVGPERELAGRPNQGRLVNVDRIGAAGGGFILIRLGRGGHGVIVLAPPANASSIRRESGGGQPRS
jgi:hypothetical protein